MELKTNVNSVVSTDSIIDKIRRTRDEYIHHLLQSDELLAFMEQNFDTAAVSPIKLEFLKRDLLEIKAQSLDLVYYASIIRHLKEINSDEVNNENPAIRREIISVFKKYGIE